MQIHTAVAICCVGLHSYISGKGVHHTHTHTHAQHTLNAQTLAPRVGSLPPGRPQFRPVHRPSEQEQNGTRARAGSLACAALQGHGEPLLDAACEGVCVRMCVGVFMLGWRSTARARRAPPGSCMCMCMFVCMCVGMFMLGLRSTARARRAPPGRCMCRCMCAYVCGCVYAWLAQHCKGTESPSWTLHVYVYVCMYVCGCICSCLACAALQGHGEPLLDAACVCVCTCVHVCAHMFVDICAGLSICAY